MLVARKYPLYLIDSAISKARLVLREQSLKLVSRTKLSTRPVFVVCWTLDSHPL